MCTLLHEKWESGRILLTPLFVRQLRIAQSTAAVKAACAGSALTAARTYVAGRLRPSADPADRHAVLQELWRLGGLSGDALEVEKARLLEDHDLLFAMASYAHIRTTAKSSPKTVLTKLLQFARRVEENTS
jgi:hypothetical protein